MQFEIPCETYSRMVTIPQNLTVDDQLRFPYFKSVYIERRNNQLYMVVSNVKLIAIEALGPDEGPDDHCAIIANDALDKQCLEEQKFNSKLKIVSVPEIGTASIVTQFGYTFPGNGFVALPQDNEFTRWRQWLPTELPKKSDGIMRWAADAVYALAMASPSGALLFSRFIDVAKPVMVFDQEAPHWIGAFMTAQQSQGLSAPEIPDWYK